MASLISNNEWRLGKKQELKNDVKYMFFLDYDDNNGDDFQLIWHKYLQSKQGESAYFTEEEVISIVEELDNKDLWLEAYTFITGVEHFYVNSSAIKIKKADMLVSIDRTQEALDVLNTIMDYDTNDVDYFLLRIEIEIILANDINPVRKWIHKASAILSADDYAELVHDLVEMLDTYYMTELFFDALSDLLDVCDDWTKEPIKDLIALIPTFVEKASRYELAISLTRKVVSQDPYNINAWMGLGTALSAHKKYAEAIDAFMYIIAINQHSHHVLLRIAHCYTRLRKHTETISVLLDYIQQKPNDLQAIRQLGQAYAKKKHCSMARYYLEKAYEQAPTDDTLIADLAQLYLDQKDYSMALTILNKTLDLTTAVPHYHGLIAHCHLELAHYTEAVHYFALALTPNLKRKDYWEGLLKVLVLTKEYEQLYQLSLKAIKHTKKQYFLYYFAYAESKLGYHDAASLTLDKAIEMAPRKFSKLNIFIPLAEIKRKTE